jgi:hypothetical protein
VTERPGKEDLPAKVVERTGVAPEVGAAVIDALVEQPHSTEADHIPRRHDNFMQSESGQSTHPLAAPTALLRASLKLARPHISAIMFLRCPHWRSTRQTKTTNL